VSLKDYAKNRDKFEAEEATFGMKERSDGKESGVMNGKRITLGDIVAGFLRRDPQFFFQMNERRKGIAQTLLIADGLCFDPETRTIRAFRPKIDTYGDLVPVSEKS